MRDIEVGFYFEETVDIDLEGYSKISGGYQFIVDFLTSFRDGEDEWFEDELYVNSEGDELYHLKFKDGEYIFGNYEDIEEAVEHELEKAMKLPVS